MLSAKETAARIVNEQYGNYSLDGLSYELEFKYSPYYSSGGDAVLWKAIQEALADREAAEELSEVPG
jgi:hypothetical protein